MFKRMIFKSQPRQNVDGERRSAGSSLQSDVKLIIQTRPVMIYSVMVVCIILSVAYFFSTRRNVDDSPFAGLGEQKPLQHSMDGIISSAEKLRELLDIQDTLNRLMDSNNLKDQDSLFIKRSFDRIQDLSDQLSRENVSAQKNQKSYESRP